METLKFKSSNRHLIAPNCPCGKSNKDQKFAPVMSANGQYDPKAGTCHSCSKFFPPDKPKNDTYSFQPRPKTVRINYVPFIQLKGTLGHYKDNSFASWLIAQYGHKVVNAAIKKYYLGTSKNGSCVFWYVDKDKNIRTAKLVKYGTDGHRDKSQPIRFQFSSKNDYKPCLFGEHLLSEHKKIVLCESEKSAVIASIAFPQLSWMATGGANTLTKKKAMPLKKAHYVYILPDADAAGREGAKRSAEILRSLGIKYEVIDLYKDRTDKTDIADWVLEQNKGIPMLTESDESIMKLAKINPAILELCKRFESEDPITKMPTSLELINIHLKQ